VEKFDRIFSNFTYFKNLDKTKGDDQIFTFKIKTLPTATKIPKSTKVNIFSPYRLEM
jgi:hypothetical protein